MAALFVIGGGSAGLTAAIGLAKVGYKVTLIEEGYLGGDCTNYGCIPSKTLLHEARTLHEAYQTLRLKKDARWRKLSCQALEKTRQTVAEFREEESATWLEKQGVTLLRGRAKFVGHYTLEVNGKIYSFDKCVVATGSRASIPPISGLKTTPYLTNKTIFDLSKPPKKLIIIGNGAIGIEMAEAFTMLGSKVTVLGRSRRILKQNEPAHTALVQRDLEKLGVKFETFKTTRVEHSPKNGFTLTDNTGRILTGDALLVAAGRTLNVELNLKAAGVEFTKAGVKISTRAQTTNPNIYAVGDVAQDYPNFTHFAYHMGKTVVTNLALQRFLPFPLHPAKLKPLQNPAVIFTSTELARAGLTYAQAKKQYRKVTRYTLDFDTVDRAITSEENGSIEVVTVGFLGRIVGVSIYAKRAGEMLPEFQTLINQKKRLLYFNELIRAYPTYTANLDTLTKEWLFNLIKKSSSKD